MEPSKKEVRNGFSRRAALFPAYTTLALPPIPAAQEI